MTEPEENDATRRQAELQAAMQFLASALGTYDPTQPDHGRASVRNALVGVGPVDSGAFSRQTIAAN